MPETPTLAVAGRDYSGLHPVLNRLVYKDERAAWERGGIMPARILSRLFSWLDRVCKVENPGYLMLIKANLPGGIAERFCCF